MEECVCESDSVDTCITASIDTSQSSISEDSYSEDTGSDIEENHEENSTKEDIQKENKDSFDQQNIRFPKYSLRRKIIEQLSQQQSYPIQKHRKKIHKIIPSTPALVLDLDETLLHTMHVNSSDINKIASLSIKKNLLMQFVSANTHMFVFYRPHLFDFLTNMQKIYNLFVYTNGTESYADIVLCTLKYRIGCQTIKKCYSRNGDILLKYLSSVKEIDPNRTIIIDDSPVVWPNDSKHVIPIQRFFGPENDDDYLEDDHLVKLSELLSNVTTYKYTNNANIYEFTDHVKNKYSEFIMNKSIKSLVSIVANLPFDT